MNYKEYEARCEEIRKANDELMDLFEGDMKNLSLKTRKQHRNNVDFFLNVYLLHEKPQMFDCGIMDIADYLGYYFIRKCGWSTPASIKRNAASIKKFYKSMKAHGKIEYADYETLCDTIKSGMPQWLADCEQYNDPDASDPFMIEF